LPSHVAARRITRYFVSSTLFAGLPMPPMPLSVDFAAALQIVDAVD
jgi:hypothetical protein